MFATADCLVIVPFDRALDFVMRFNFRYCVVELVPKINREHGGTRAEVNRYRNALIHSSFHFFVHSWIRSCRSNGGGSFVAQKNVWDSIRKVFSAQGA